MALSLTSELQAALNEEARRLGTTPDALAIQALRERFLSAAPLQPCDEWERGLLAAAKNYGVSLPDVVLSSEGLYE